LDGASPILFLLDLELEEDDDEDEDFNNFSSVLTSAINSASAGAIINELELVWDTSEPELEDSSDDDIATKLLLIVVEPRLSKTRIQVV
jgi:hypothetical protein